MERASLRHDAFPSGGDREYRRASQGQFGLAGHAVQDGDLSAGRECLLAFEKDCSLVIGGVVVTVKFVIG